MKALRVLLSLLLLPALGAAAADPDPKNPDPALVDAIVRKLEASGALDRAVDQAIERYVQRQQQAQNAAAAQQRAQLSERAKGARKVDAKRDHIRGNPKAQVSLIEYSDYECPFCKRLHPTMLKIAARYGDRVNWVWRHYPLPIHEPAARHEALAAECAAQIGGHNGFWKYSDLVLQNTRSDGRGLPDGLSLQDLAVKAGLSQSKFAECAKQQAGAAAINEDIADATQIGVQATPTMLIRNNATGETEVVVGAQPLEAITPQIDRILGGAR
jgi:protein-disulfide isomerase